MYNIFIRALHQTVFKTWHHLEKEIEYTVFSTLPGIGCLVLCNRKRTVVTDSCVKVSSGCSLSSPRRNMPLFRRALTVHKAWTVRPKCLPWCTSGSVLQLGFKVSVRLDPPYGNVTHGFFLGPSSKAPGRFWPAGVLEQLPSSQGIEWSVY